MIRHTDILPHILIRNIKDKKIVLAGNEKLKIYGILKCNSGKRMKKENRVFFSSEQEALYHGYRPCGHCMKVKYKEWKSNPGSDSD